MTLYRGYQGAASVCSGGPTPGAKALMSWFLGAYKNFDPRNDGIYNCRPVRGGVTPSVHGEGRATDLGCKAGAAWAQKLADQLVANSAELGIQCVIFNRRIWSGAHPDAGWRAYPGVDAHDTHLHVELSRKAAAGLSVARIVQVLTPQEEEDVKIEFTDAQLARLAQFVLDAPIELTQAAADAIGSELKPGDTVSLRYAVLWSPLVRRSAREEAGRDAAELVRDQAEAERDRKLQGTVDALAAAVAQIGRLPTSGGVDLDALATAVADKLAARLKT